MNENKKLEGAILLQPNEMPSTAIEMIYHSNGAQSPVSCMKIKIFAYSFITLPCPSKCTFEKPT